MHGTRQCALPQQWQETPTNRGVLFGRSYTIALPHQSRISDATLGELTCGTRTASLRRGAGRLEMQNSLCQPHRLLSCVRLRGTIPFWAQNEAYARTIASWAYFPYCMWSVVLCTQPKGAIGFFDPVLIPPPILAWSMVKGKRRRKGCYPVFVYGPAIQEAQPLSPAAVVRSLFCLDSLLLPRAYQENLFPDV